MNRKKWTPKEVVTETDLLFREKRKWQLALRRYVLEKKPSAMYAPYFGLDLEGFRQWIELQFTPGLNWDNFATAWQFDHLVPVACFDFSSEADLKLCWNFMNIRVEPLGTATHNTSLLAVKRSFEALYEQTGYSFCKQMLDKLAAIEASGMVFTPAITDYIARNKEQLEQIASFTEEEFAQFNSGTSLNDLLLQREILKKFGG